MRRADAKLDHFQPALNVALGVGNGLAVFGGQNLCQLFHVTVEQADEFHHHPRPALRVGVAPFDLRCGSIGGGGVQFGLGRQSHPALHFAGGRVEHIGELARCARDVLAVDPVTDLFHDALPWLLAE